jgi:hypothetical protein
VNEVKPFKFELDANIFCLILISDAHFSGQAVLIFNAKVKDVIISSHTKKLIRNGIKLTVVIEKLGEDKGSFDGLLLVTLFIFPKAYTHISTTLPVFSFSLLNFFSFIPFTFIKNSCTIKEIFVFDTTFSKVMVLGCFSIKFPSNNPVTVTFRANPLFIPTALFFAAPTFQLSGILF